MTKLKRSGVLIGILFAGLLVVESLPAAGQQLQLPNYGTLSQACLGSNVSVSACLVAAKAVSQLNAVLKSGSFNQTSGSLNETSVFFGPVEAEIRRGLNLLGGASCTDCENATKQFEDLLAQNGTVKDIQTQLKNGCAQQFADPTTQQQCDQFMDKFLPQIIQFIVANLPPAKVCTDFGFCPAP